MACLTPFVIAPHLIKRQTSTPPKRIINSTKCVGLRCREIRPAHAFLSERLFSSFQQVMVTSAAGEGLLRAEARKGLRASPFVEKREGAGAILRGRDVPSYLCPDARDLPGKQHVPSPDLLGAPAGRDLVGQGLGVLRENRQLPETPPLHRRGTAQEKQRRRGDKVARVGRMHGRPGQAKRRAPHAGCGANSLIGFKATLSCLLTTTAKNRQSLKNH